MTNRSTPYRIVLVIGLIIAGVILARNTHISDSALDMLPDKAVRGDLHLLQQLGMVDRIFITLSVDKHPDHRNQDPFKKLTGSVEQIGKLLNETNQFDTLLYKLPQGYETSLFTLLQPHLPLLLDENDLAALEQMITNEGIQKAMAHNFALLNSLAGIGLKRQIQQDPLGITTLLLGKLKHLKSSFSMTLRDGFFLSKDGKSILLIAVSKLRLTEGNSAEQIQRTLDDAFSEGLEPGVTPRIIGTLPHTLANMHSIRHDLRTLIPIATLLLLSLLLLGLRSAKAFLVLAIPFLAAPAAIGITNLLYGQVGGLALGFGIVLLGIAVDFSIHLYLALRYESGTRKQILQRIRKPILLATVTTTSVFIVLLFSQVPSHKQMATLALVGILLAVLFSYLIIPPMVSRKNGGGGNTNTFSWLNHSSLQSYRTPLLLLWLIFVIGGTLCWSGLKYKGDLRVLDVADNSVIEDEDYFRKTWEQQGEQGFLIARGQNLEEALNNNSIIYSTLTRHQDLSFQSIGPILPSYSMQKRNLSAWKTFWEEEQTSLKKRFATIAVSQGFVADGFAPFFTWLKNDTSFLTPEKLANSPLSPFINSMVRKIDGAGSNRDSGHYLILTTVDTSAGLTQPLLELDKQQGITLISNFKWRNQVEDLLRRDILFLTLSCGCLILLIATITFRKINRVVAVLAPVLSALASMAIFSYVNGAELNMMHLLMGIMVIGLSVDYGIFIVCSRLGKPSNISFLGVSICAASSLIGFGVLSFAQHPALSSLGITVLMGIGAAWPTAILITPLILGPKMTPEQVDMT